MILSYLIVFLILLLIGLIYHRLAIRSGIVDRPNHRSSHNYATVRGGGILFPIAVIFWWMMFDFTHTWMVLGVIWVSSISLLDDMYTISRKLRFGVQILALSMVFYDLEVFDSMNWIALAGLYVISLGIINAINFMDGINGISGLYILVFLGTVLAVQEYYPIFDEGLIRYLILAILAFLFFNLRKQALMFAGDIGSISLALMIVYFLVQWYLMSETWTVIGMLAVYGVDVVMTIAERVIRGENPLEPHRSHLYQLLANEFRLPHVNIALAYALLQGGLNMVLFIIPRKEPDSFLAFLVILGLAIVYLTAKILLKRRLQLSGCPD
jgi:UDP-N-acetylmuramyl pentapeptide phosphotransferase/UDP-N-acetylglucosamine-1-phosphate transferase